MSRSRKNRPAFTRIDRTFFVPPEMMRESMVLAAKDPLPAHTFCAAMTRQGEQCHRRPIPGGHVCTFHGGSSILARSVAKQRLLAMCEPAFSVLLEVMEHGDDDVRTKAAIAVLDRAGFGPKQTLTIDNRKEELAGMSDQELEERMMSLISTARNVMPVIDIAPNASPEDPGPKVSAPFVGEVPVGDFGHTASYDSPEDSGPGPEDTGVVGVGDSKGHTGTDG